MQSGAVDDGKAAKRHRFRVGSEVREYHVDGIRKFRSRVAVRIDVRGMAACPFVGRIRRVVWTSSVGAHSRG